jgi:maltooligosyltrehalose trehalohydrolase
MVRFGWGPQSIKSFMAGHLTPNFPWWYPCGAEPNSAGTHFRVWAPKHSAVGLLIAGRDGVVDLAKDEEGYFDGFVAGIGDGARYAYSVDGKGPFPDPASRSQPEGPLKFSQVIDPGKFRWNDAAWRGVRIEGQVIYELHLGTFTHAGTSRAAVPHLGTLAKMGITAIELMPVADFPGEFGWGYDGVDLFAPTRLYGTPDDLRAFVDQAHALGIAVLLDVVYNHLGPDGNFLPEFSENYFSKKHVTDWGGAIHFYGEGSAPVREFFAANAAYWIAEFHFDGLRLDATQNIYDESQDHILAMIARNCRKAAGDREIILIAENESQNTKLVQPAEKRGYGLDAMWNDDFHHSATVGATGRQEAYYTDYLGAPQELISAAKYGFLYQGQWYAWQKQRRGAPALHLKPAAMVNFLQNHDQIANSGRGQRLHSLTTPGRLRAMTALLLLAPGTPMLFQGQEFAASAPFLFFADQTGKLANVVRKGRTEFLSQWRSLATGQLNYADPCDRETFNLCKLNHEERDRNAAIVLLHADLLRLRCEQSVFARQKRQFDGAVLAHEAFVLRFFGHEPSGDRLLVINLGRYLHLNPAPEPLLAPPENSEWGILWSSEDPRYGGDGTAPLDSELNWTIPAHAAVVLEPIPVPRKVRTS